MDERSSSRFTALATWASTLFPDSSVAFAHTGPLQWPIPGVTKELASYIVFKIVRPLGQILEIGMTTRALTELHLSDIEFGLRDAIRHALRERGRWIFSGDFTVHRCAQSELLPI